MYDLILKNGLIVESDRIYKGNVCINKDKIVAIESCDREACGKQIIDVEGKLVMSGAIDAHMHIGEYKADFEEMDTSTMACAVGGVTCCVDMPLNLYSPSVLNGEIFEEKKKHLLEKSYIDFCMWGALVPCNIDKLEEMHNLGAVSFKSFMSGAGSDFKAPNNAEIKKALQTIKKFNGLAGFHCEDYSIIYNENKFVVDNKINTRQAFLDSRPLCAEKIAVENIIELAEETGARVHICHVSHPEVAELIRQAKKRGVDISGETCVHYLAFNEKDFLEKGCLYKCAPPLRSKEAMEGLWEYILDDTLSCIVSDHSPGMPELRDDTNAPTYEMGNGISGVQTMVQTYFDLVMKKGLSPTLLAKTLAEAPAKRWGIFGKKGAVRVGFDADIMVIDPNALWEVKAEDLYYKQKISAYIGMKGKGKPIMTFIRGELVAENGKIAVNMPTGKFVRGGCCNE